MEKTIKDFELYHKRVLIRCDFNVPIQEGKIIDDNRIVESLETIEYALKHQAKVILFSHLGKVKTEKDLEGKSLKVVAEHLEKLLKRKVIFVSQTRGTLLENSIKKMNPGEIVLVENTRYEDIDGQNESTNNEELGTYWANLGDLFINDAFATSHRSHASNVGIAKKLPSGIGFLIEKEIANLEILSHPKKPYVVILGGAKISDKIAIISSLIDKADKLLIGGAMAYTFLYALGYEIGKSIMDENSVLFAKNMLEKYSEKIILPKDVCVTTKMQDSPDFNIVKIDHIKKDEIGLDIGPETIAEFQDQLKDAQTIFWNGTLGYSEFSHYAKGTKEMMRFLSQSLACVILGGGDTVAASKNFGYKEKMTYASTGGGATLEYIAGKTLPGIESIDKK